MFEQFRVARRRSAAVLALAGLLGGSLAVCAGAAQAAPAHTAADPTGLAALAQQVVDAGAPGVVVRVEDGHGRVTEIVRQAAWARADAGLAVADQFRMGSNTKTMVATLVLQLVAEHRVNLTDTVEKWLPGQVPGGRAITVRMLLDHTSGLFDITHDPAVLAAFLGQDAHQWTPRELLAAGVRHAPLFPPGRQFSYSNTNYIALGLILERATGRSLGTLVQQRIARPLGLTHTYLADSPATSSRQAHGYEPDAAHLALYLPPGVPAGTSFAGPARGAWVDTTAINHSTLWAAGGIVSTAADWARFDRALLSGRLLPAAQLEEMKATVPEDPKDPSGNGYGLGLRKVVFPCGTVWGHDGQAAGYSSVAYTDAAGRGTVTILVPTIFGLAAPAAAAAEQALEQAAVCAVLGEPGPRA